MVVGSLLETLFPTLVYHLVFIEELCVVTDYLIPPLLAGFAPPATHDYW